MKDANRKAMFARMGKIRTRKQVIHNENKKDGIDIKYSPINQGYLVTWHNQLLRVFNDKNDALEYTTSLKRKKTNWEDSKW